MHAPTESHWVVVKRILRYLKGTSSYSIHLTHGSYLSLHGFTYADWAWSVDDRKSTSGYIDFLGTTPVSWKSVKQHTIARSSTKVEYKALADGTAEILWLCYLLTDLCFSPSYVTTIWCDNLGATYLSTNPIFHAQTKHVEVDYHFVRNQVAKKKIQIRFISSKDSHTLTLHLLFYVPSFIWITHLQLEGVYYGMCWNRKYYIIDVLTYCV